MDMEQRNEFDIDADAHKFCSSWFSLRVANVGAALAVRSWNEHPIPGMPCQSELLYFDYRNARSHNHFLQVKELQIG